MLLVVLEDTSATSSRLAMLATHMNDEKLRCSAGKVSSRNRKWWQLHFGQQATQIRGDGPWNQETREFLP
jgi:hypothetical protein